jgi:hypothetical protein
MAFTTIFIAPDLTPAQRRRARRVGPRAVAARRDHADLLAAAGFVDIEEHDLTPAFVLTARAWLHESEQHATELAAIESPEVFAERQRDRRAMLAALEDGLLRRALFTGVRPSR